MKLENIHTYVYETFVCGLFQIFKSLNSLTPGRNPQEFPLLVKYEDFLELMET